MNPGKCQYCNKLLLVLPTSTGSVLPVDYDERQTYTNDTIYDPAVHTSHLLNCADQRNAWPAKKKKYIKTILPGITPKELHR